MLNLNKQDVGLIMLVVGLCLMMILFAGCEEAVKQPVWGEGELEPDYVRFFGTDNTARLNKAQNDLLNKHDAIIHGINQVVDGKTVHINGLIDIVVALEGRVKALEAVDPNELTLESRIEVLENEINDPSKVVRCDTKFYNFDWIAKSDGADGYWITYDKPNPKEHFVICDKCGATVPDKTNFTHFCPRDR